jgi:hypothetical protein
LCNAVKPFLSFIFTSIPPIINNSTVLLRPFQDAKLDDFCLFLIFYFNNFILNKPLCNAVPPHISCILISIPPFINNLTVLSCPAADAKIDYIYLNFRFKSFFIQTKM